MDINELHELVERYVKGIATDAEKQKLQQWYQSNYKEEVGENAGWNTNGKHRIFRQLGNRIPELVERKPRYWLSGWQIAASLVVLIAVGLLLYTGGFWRREDASFRFVTVTNPGGEVKQLTLPDNSKVWLNAGSSLKYADDFTQNRITVLEGEGFFEVVHDNKHPFSVHTGKLCTRVLGTAFNIKAYPDEGEIAVAVEQGSVAVTRQQQELATLHPLDRVVYEVSSDQAVIGRADLKDVIAIKSGEIRFHAMRLDRIANELERKYNITIQFKNPDLADCVYTAAFGQGVELEDLLLMLCSVNNIDYAFSEDGKTVLLSGVGCG